jgi:hypothetical protein
MKSGKNGQTESQKAFQKDAELVGNKYVIVRTFDEFVKEISYYLNGIQST